MKTIQLIGLTVVAAISVTIAATQPWAEAADSMKGSSSMMKAKSALAPELQGKPVVVDIYASWCPGCKSIAPTLSKLKQQYSGKVNFVVFDVSDRGSTASAQNRAKQLGLNNYFQANKSQTALVAIINPATGEVIQEFRSNANIKDYQTSLNMAFQKISSK